MIRIGSDKIPYIDLGNDYKIRLEYEELKEEKYILKAQNELRETPELLEKSMKEFRQLIEDEKDFLFPTQEQFLKSYLRPSKFYTKSAFEKLQKYYKFKLKHPKICNNITVDSVRNVFEDGLIMYYPLRDCHGRRILYLQCGERWNPQRVSTNDIFRGIQLSLIAAMAEPMTQVNGVCVLADMSGLSLSQVIHFTPAFAANMLEWIQECIPVRLRAIYIVNNSYIFNMLFSIFKPFISAKLRKRIHIINKNYNILTDDLGTHCVSMELGGELKVNEVDGKLMYEFLKLFDAQFELVSCAGYDIKDEAIKKKIHDGIQDALSFIS